MAGLPEPAPALPPEPAAPLQPGLSAAVGLILCGTAVLWFTALFEQSWRAGLPWSHALVMAEADAVPEGAVRTYVRPLPKDYFEQEHDEIKQTLEYLGEGAGQPLTKAFARTEQVIAAPVAVETLEQLIVSGRVPKPGAREVLAGQLTRLEEFALDWAEYRVVGRIQPGVSGFAFRYLLPIPGGEPPAGFRPGSGATVGWLHPQGFKHFDTLFPESAEDPRALPGIPQIYARTQTHRLFAWSGWAGLVLVAAGGVVLFWRLTTRWANRNTLILRPLLQESVNRPQLWLGFHIGFYAVFFGAMIQGLSEPLMALRLMDYATGMFSEGDLKYIGDAYSSRNVWRAAFATFQNNYVLQTLVLTFLISIPPLALGVLKNLGSFALVGYIMTPAWVGTAGGYTFHSITMILELEAYILACFAVTVWPIRIFRAVRTGAPKGELIAGIAVLVSAVVATGIILALAALYEAATLILLAG